MRGSVSAWAKTSNPKLEAHILWYRSTREYYKMTKYELPTPTLGWKFWSMHFWTRSSNFAASYSTVAEMVSQEEAELEEILPPPPFGPPPGHKSTTLSVNFTQMVQYNTVLNDSIQCHTIVFPSTGIE